MSVLARSSLELCKPLVLTTNVPGWETVVVVIITVVLVDAPGPRVEVLGLRVEALGSRVVCGTGVPALVAVVLVAGRPVLVRLVELRFPVVPGGLVVPGDPVVPADLVVSANPVVPGDLVVSSGLPAATVDTDTEMIAENDDSKKCIFYQEKLASPFYGH